MLTPSTKVTPAGFDGMLTPSTKELPLQGLTGCQREIKIIRWSEQDGDQSLIPENSKMNISISNK